MSDRESFIDRATSTIEKGWHPQAEGAVEEYVADLEALLQEAIKYLAPAGTTKDETPYDAILAIYHLRCARMPKVLKLSDRRKRSVRKRWEEEGQNSLAFWHSYFQRAAKCPLLVGDTGNGWKADFEWLVNPANMLKVLEGRYDNARVSNRPNPAAQQNDFLAGVMHEHNNRTR